MYPKGLKYVCDSDDGIYRKGRGKGFIYVNGRNEKVEDEKIISRIDQLIIPPNWKNVWICPEPNGYLQVTGYDQKGRKQYLYHKDYITFQQNGKFSSLYKFGITLPRIRGKVQRDLKMEGWPKEKVLALIVKTLDEYYLRIGNQSYMLENDTYGLTTLRRRHIKESKNGLVIEFKAKSGKFKTINISNPRLRGLIKETSELPGHEIFRYLDEDKKSRKVNSQDVNDYIRQIAENDFTAKDFRTWGGTVTAVEVCDEAKKLIEENPRKKLETAIIKKVAERLGNTIATCREYYIHPRVLNVVINKEISKISEILPEDVKYEHLLRKSEKKVLNIIK